MVSLTISSVLIALVASVFLAQNDFYAMVVQRTRVQENLRVVTDLIASEVRGISAGGVTRADERSFVVRYPLAVGGVCAAEAAAGHVHMPGLSEIDGTEVAGYAVASPGGDWTYTAQTWVSTLLSSGSADAELCILASGSDTVGASQDFGYLSIPGGTSLGDVIMIYQEVEFKIEQSELDPRTLAIFRGVTGDALREFATGITSGSYFEYRKGDGTYYGSITGAALDSIDGVRITATAIGTDSVGIVASYTYGWTVKIPLRNSK